MIDHLQELPGAGGTSHRRYSSNQHCILIEQRHASIY
jgi:hypothetical protein